jgi:transcriptional regulator with XRE-family HTH domain
MIATWPDDVGRVIRQRRIDLGLSQDDLAARAGVTRQLLSRLELANADVSLTRVLAILRELDLTVDVRPRGPSPLAIAESTHTVTMSDPPAARLAMEAIAAAAKSAGTTNDPDSIRALRNTLAHASPALPAPSGPVAELLLERVTASMNQGVSVPRPPARTVPTQDESSPDDD